MKLKNCPFCGGKAEVRTGEHEFLDAYVGCEYCGASGGLVNDSNGKNDKETGRLNIEVAVENWNKRFSN